MIPVNWITRMEEFDTAAFQELSNQRLWLPHWSTALALRVGAQMKSSDENVNGELNSGGGEQERKRIVPGLGSHAMH